MSQSCFINPHPRAPPFGHDRVRAGSKLSSFAIRATEKRDLDAHDEIPRFHQPAFPSPIPGPFLAACEPAPEPSTPIDPELAAMAERAAEITITRDDWGSPTFTARRTRMRSLARYMRKPKTTSIESSGTSCSHRGAWPRRTANRRSGMTSAYASSSTRWRSRRSTMKVPPGSKT